MSGKKSRMSEPGTGQTRFGLEETDLYDHTGMFFEGGVGEEVAEMGQRNLRAEVELDELVYAGKKVDREQLEEESMDEDEGMEESEGEQEEEGESENDEEAGEEEQEELDQQSESNLGQLEDLKDSDEDLDFALERLQDYTSTSKVARVRQTQASEADKGKAIRVQQKIGNELLHQRILMQKLLTHSLKMPKGEALNAFIKRDHEIKEGVLLARRKLKEHIKGLQSLQKTLIQISEDISSFPEEIKDSEGDEDEVEHLYSQLERNFEGLMPWVEETVDRWNARTQLYKNINQEAAKVKTGQKSIIQNVKEAIEGKQNYEKLLKKSQMKQGVKKALGDPAVSVTSEYDPEIFNDHDFYQCLLKDFLESNNETSQNEDSRFLNGANLSLTQQFLEKRKKMKEGAGGEEQRKKLVERKASKNRQIRYVVHEKLVNFMPKVVNDKVMTEADQIVDSLFGRKNEKRRKVEEDLGDFKLI